MAGKEIELQRLQQWSKNLKRARIQRGWSQAELAYQSGVALRTIASIESAREYRTPHRRTLTALAKALDMDAARLFRGLPPLPKKLRSLGYGDDGD